MPVKTYYQQKEFELQMKERLYLLTKNRNDRYIIQDIHEACRQWEFTLTNAIDLIRDNRAVACRVFQVSERTLYRAIKKREFTPIQITYFLENA